VKFIIVRTSDPDAEEKPYEDAEFVEINSWGENLWEVEINSLKELQEVVLNTKCPIILDYQEEREINKWSIEIYDGCRE
jgi:hypothetical protein